MWLFFTWIGIIQCEPHATVKGTKLEGTLCRVAVLGVIRIDILMAQTFADTIFIADCSTYFENLISSNTCPKTFRLSWSDARIPSFESPLSLAIALFYLSQFKSFS